MDPLNRKLVQAALRTSKKPVDTVSDLVARLVQGGILKRDLLMQHMDEIIGIWQEWKDDAALSPPDSNIDARQDDADSNALTGRLALYGPVDDKVQPGSISLFKPQSATFGFAHIKQSQGPVSFIQAKTVQANKLQLDEDGTIVIQWRYPSHVKDDFGDRDDQTARHTCCVVLSAEEAKEVGMKVDVVFGIHYLEGIGEQSSYIPPPRYSTPPQAPPSDMHQLDDLTTSSLGDVDDAAHQALQTHHPGGYSPTCPPPAGLGSLTVNGGTVNFYISTSDPLAFAGHLVRPVGNRGAASGAGLPAAPIHEAQASGGASKRKADDGDAQTFGRSKKFQC